MADGPRWITAAEAGFTSISKTLTNDQILHLPTENVEIIPSPGVGFGINVISCILTLDTTAGEYDLSGQSTVPAATLFYTVGGQALQCVYAWSLDIAQKVTGVIGVFFPTGAGDFSTVGFNGGGSTIIDNSSVSLGDYLNFDTDYSGGNSANSLKVKIHYSIEAL